MSNGVNPRALIVVGVVLGVLVLAVTLRSAKTSIDGGDAPIVVLRVAPAIISADPGPTYVAGAEGEPNGARFVAADFYIEGAGDCRVYFDRRDNANFHFMDRKGANVTLGLSEAGLEQVFSSSKLESAAPLRLARHGPNIGLFQQGRLLVGAFDDRLTGGTGGFRMLSGEPAVSLRVEPRDDIHFADDFMIMEGRSAQWRSNGGPERGEFKVRSLRHPLLSANAFSYMGSGSNIYSVVGEPWWDRYSYEVSMRGPAAGTMGLVFAFQDERNYGLFRWSARKLDAAGAVIDAGKRELVCLRGGTEEVLAQAVGGYLPDQWYAAQIRVTYGRVSVALDGHNLMEASDPCLTAGQAGVWCDVPVPGTLALEPRAQAFQENSLEGLMRQHAVFDDVRI
ncbi:MAG: hypothetical protein NTW87_34725, partial [Planctomycetota bacterium]|nr:hypothetical protein [Planctomycetota bacterium]